MRAMRKVCRRDNSEGAQVEDSISSKIVLRSVRQLVVSVGRIDVEGSTNEGASRRKVALTSRRTPPCATHTHRNIVPAKLFHRPKSHHAFTSKDSI